jgi:hypothetical protein
LSYCNPLLSGVSSGRFGAPATFAESNALTPGTVRRHRSHPGWPRAHDKRTLTPTGLELTVDTLAGHRLTVARKPLTSAIRSHLRTSADTTGEAARAMRARWSRSKDRSAPPLRSSLENGNAASRSLFLRRWRDGRKQVRLTRCSAPTASKSYRWTIAARVAGQLCGTADVIDATVGLCAQTRGRRVTPDDLRHLDASLVLIGM